MNAENLPPSKPEAALQSTPSKVTQKSNQTNKTSDQPSDKKPGWIRWSGVVALAAMVGLGYGLWNLGLSAIIKSQINQQASQMWGAKVTVGELALTLDPLALQLKQIELTDLDNPSENLLEIEQVAVQLSFYHWVVGRTVVEDVVVKGLKLHQARSESGALEKDAVAQPDGQTNAPVPSPTKPAEASIASGQTGLAEESNTYSASALANQLKAITPPKELLARADLDTEKKVQQINQKLAEIDQAWLSLNGQIPNKTELSDYEARFKALTQGRISHLDDIKARQEDYKQLEQELGEKRLAVASGLTNLKAELKQLKLDLAELKTLPKTDYNRLVAEYTFDEQGATNLAYLLFGPKVQGWVQQGLDWVKIAAPYVEKMQEAEAEPEKPVRSLGTDIAFQEFDAQPDWIIKRIIGSASLDYGAFDFALTNLTKDQARSGMATRYHATLQPVGQPQPLKLQGVYDGVNPSQVENYVLIDWPNYQINQWRLSGDKALPLEMASAHAVAKGRLDFAPGGKVAGKLNIDYSQTAFVLGAQADRTTQRYLKPVFEGVNQFSVVTALNGALISPRIGVSSDLDTQFKRAFGQMVRQEVAGFKADLKRQLEERVRGGIAPIEAKLAALTGREVSLEAQYKALSAMNRQDFEQKLTQYKQAFIAEQKARLQAELEAKKQAAALKLAQEKARLEAEVAAKKLAAEQKLAEQKAALAKQAELEKEKLRQQAEAEKQKQQAAAQKAVEDQLKNTFKNKLKF